MQKSAVTDSSLIDRYILNIIYLSTQILVINNGTRAHFYQTVL